jgi:C-terminal processing protease CtpA/Prc
MTFTFTSEAATTTQPTQGATMNVEMIEPTVPATPTQPTQGVFMDNFQAPNLVGIIMQALEQHIEAMVDKRFNERMASIPAPDFEELLMLKDELTETIDEKMSEIKDEINEMIDEKISDHTSEYDHDEYDQTVRTVDDAELDDIEAKIKDVMRGMTITLDL